jgi:deoxyribodipyrimidine photo-lyase
MFLKKGKKLSFKVPLQNTEEDCEKEEDRIIQSSDDERSPSEKERHEAERMEIRKRLQMLKSRPIVKPKLPINVARKKKLTETERMHANGGKTNIGSHLRLTKQKRKKTADGEYQVENTPSSETDDDIDCKKSRKSCLREELDDLTDQDAKKRKKPKKVYPKRPPPEPPEPDSNDEREADILINNINDLEIKEDEKIRVIVVLNNSNLRLDDNSLLKIAIGIGLQSESYEVIPIYWMLPELFKKNGQSEDEKFLKEKFTRGIIQTNFILENAKELKQSLRELGSDLLIAYKNPHEYVKQFIRKDRKNILIVEREVTPAESKAEYELTKLAFENNIKVCKVWSSTIYHLQDLPIEIWKFPHLFGRFKKIVSSVLPREPVEPPIEGELIFPEHKWLLNEENENLDPSTIIDYEPELKEFGFEGEDFDLLISHQASENMQEFPRIPGEKTALKTMRAILSNTDNFQSYFYIKNSLFQEKLRQTDLYPWLTSGSLSPRRLYSHLTKLEIQHKHIRGQLAYFKIDLLWKDFLKFWGLKNKQTFFTAEYGVYDRNHFKWTNDREILQRVKEGKAGMPMIDALVRWLKKTGYISPRGRMIFAHYFSQDLRQDWRIGAEFFQSHQIDFEMWNIYGGWHTAAGIGPGKIYRFHVLNQGQAFDSDGSFIKHYVPELKRVPLEFIHDPYRMSKEMQEEWGVKIGETYPTLIKCERYTKIDRRYPLDRTLEGQKATFEKIIKPGSWINQKPVDEEDDNLTKASSKSSSTSAQSEVSQES